jgi:hypothetical protein
MRHLKFLLSLALTNLTSSALGLSIVNPHTIQSISDVYTSVSHVVEHSTTVASSATHATNPLELYKQTLAAHPLPTKMITGGTLAVAGDAIAQSRSKDEEYDKRRASSFMAFDMCYRALQHVSFPVIVQQCQGQYIGGAIASIPLIASFFNNLGLENPAYYYGAMEQTLASQLGIVPFIYYPVFYVLTAFVQGLDAEGAVNRAKETFIPLMKRNLLFWIPVQFVQFGFIEESLQIPFLAVAGLAWTFIISLFAGNAKKSYSDDEATAVEMSSDDLKELENIIVEHSKLEDSKNIIEEKETVMR